MFSLDKRNIRVAISPWCNSNCVYCHGQKSREAGKPGAMEDFRHKPLDFGVIDTKTYLKIIEALHSSGFIGMTLTGGEPFLNPDWDKIVRQSYQIGMSRIGVTTNGLLLKSYLKKNKRLPAELSLLTISLDTIDPCRFKAITGRDKLKEILESLKIAKKSNPDLLIRANKILLRSDMADLLEYIDYIDKAGFIDEVNLLNLILKEKQDKDFFEAEFISATEALEYFKNNSEHQFLIDEKYEHFINLQSGLKIIIKDTDATLRNENCDNCPIYCQEGYFTVRVGTDGTITTCPDYRSILPYIDGLNELKTGDLSPKIEKIVRELRDTEKRHTLNDFADRYEVKIRTNDKK